MEFTYAEYENIIDTLRTEGYTFNKYTSDMSMDKSVLLRHDVDWSPRKALKMAEIEREYGATSTYFFLLSSQFYNAMNKDVRNKILRIKDMGHEVGLHFSTHQYWGSEPDVDLLRDRVEQELSVLSSILEENVEVMAFHNPPEWVIRQEYEGFVSTYEPRFFDNIDYTADSNQRWDENPLSEDLPEKLQILTHPFIWGSEDGSVTQRLKEERSYVIEKIDQFMEEENDIWD